jgi:hypothetical protein
MVDEESPRAALPPSDWRAPRCDLSKDLIEPATEDEKLTWDVDLLKELSGRDGSAVNLEDIDGYYKSIGCSKISSDAEVAENFEELWQKARRGVIKYHPDKKTANPTKYQKAKSKFDKLKRTKEVLCTKDNNGCFAERVAYDKKGECFRAQMKQVSIAA